MLPCACRYSANFSVESVEQLNSAQSDILRSEGCGLCLRRGRGPWQKGDEKESKKTAEGATAAASTPGGAAQTPRERVFRERASSTASQRPDLPENGYIILRCQNGSSQGAESCQHVVHMSCALHSFTHPHPSFPASPAVHNLRRGPNSEESSLAGGPISPVSQASMSPRSPATPHSPANTNVNATTGSGGSASGGGSGSKSPSKKPSRFRFPSNASGQAPALAPSKPSHVPLVRPHLSNETFRLAAFPTYPLKTPPVLKPGENPEVVEVI